jgi:hypothetical protein
VETSIFFPAKNNADFTIFMQPKWLSFSSMYGKVVNGVVPLSFNILKEKINAGYQTTYGNLILDITDAGLLSVVVAYSDFGNPELQCSTSVLNFDSSDNLTFSLANISNGFLDWYITGLPEWLSISTSSGQLGTGNSILITATLIPGKIPSGQEMTGSLLIHSNSRNGATAIALHVPPSVIIPSSDSKITGIVTDAEYNQKNGIMAIITKSPNSLILFNTVTKTFNTIDLSMTPKCISIAEDGHKAVIGYTVAYASYIDLDNPRIIKDFTITCIPFDIVLGDNAWCYIAPATGDFINLLNLNLESGQMVSCNNWNRMYQATIIKKVPGQPYLMGTCTALSPSGIETFSISKGIANDSIGHYHVDAGNLWISGDATKLYTQGKNVYLFLKHDVIYHFDGPSMYGQIVTNFDYLSAFSECQATNSFFISYYSSYNSSGSQSVIQQYNTTNLNQIKSYNVAPVYITEGGITTKYMTDARFVFVTKDGSELYAVKNLKANYSKDYCTLEKLQITSR